MTHTPFVKAFVLGSLLVASTARLSAAQSGPVEIATGTSVPIAAGATLTLRAVNGEASFLKAPGDQVVVEFARAVPADVKMFMMKTAGGVLLCSVYTSTDPKKPTECTGRLTAGKAKDQSRVQYRIRVPAGVHVSATMEHGDLKSMDVAGNLNFYSSNGDLLIYDAGGPGTIDASIGLLGNIDVAIAKVQKGPSRRLVKMHAPGTGRVRVVMPTNLSVTYRVGSQRPAIIDPVFRVEKIAPPILIGHLGPSSESILRLDVETGIAGQFILQAAK